MLELTKVINELKDVLIQQVKPSWQLPFCLMFLISTIPYYKDFLCLHACLQVKETSFLRNTISECQACGKTLWWARHAWYAWVCWCRYPDKKPKQDIFGVHKYPRQRLKQILQSRLQSHQSWSRFEAGVQSWSVQLQTYHECFQPHHKC